MFYRLRVGVSMIVCGVCLGFWWFLLFGTESFSMVLSDCGIFLKFANEDMLRLLYDP